MGFSKYLPTGGGIFRTGQVPGGLSARATVTTPCCCFGSDLETGGTEHVEHRRVLAEDDRVEAPEPIRRGELREPLEEDGPESLALDRIGDGERSLRDAVTEVEIGGDGHESKPFVLEAKRDHGRLTRRVARIAEGVDERLGRIGQAEEAALSRARRQLVEEAPQLALVCGPADAERGDAAVAELSARIESFDRQTGCGRDGHLIAVRATAVPRAPRVSPHLCRVSPAAKRRLRRGVSRATPEKSPSAVYSIGPRRR